MNCKNPTGGAIGIDINHNDAVTNFAQLTSNGVDYIFYKASQGVDFRDPAFCTRWELAGERGYTRGAYHFLDPSLSAHDQFALFQSQLNAAGGATATDILILDWETDNATTARHQQAVTWFIQELQQVYGGKPLVYCNMDFAKRYANEAIAQFDLYLAEYGVSNPDLSATPWSEKGWRFWQFAADNTGWILPGCSNRLDTNVYSGSHDELRSYMFGITAPTGDNS